MIVHTVCLLFFFLRLSLSLSLSLSLTDCLDDVIEGAVGDEGLRQLPEEELKGAGDHVDVLPLRMVQVQLLF